MLRDYREHYKPRRQIDCGGVIITLLFGKENDMTYGTRGTLRKPKPAEDYLTKTSLEDAKRDANLARLGFLACCLSAAVMVALIIWGVTV